MSYVISIRTAIIIFPFIALVFSIPFILHGYHKYGSINPLRVFIVYSFILYMLTIYFLVILPLPDRSEVAYNPNMVNLIPFGFIEDIKEESSLVLRDSTTYLKALKEPCFYTVIFNIFMTIPFGMYLRYYFKSTLKKTMLISFLLSLFFEVTQVTGLYFLYPNPYRVFDVDDLLMNTLGGIIGYFLMGVIDHFLPTRDEIDETSRKNGEVVSGLRRIAVFLLDIFISNILVGIISIFLKGKYCIPLTMIAYYIVYPYFKNGETLGSKFLNVRLEFSKYRVLNLIARTIFLYTYYFGSIRILFKLSVFTTNLLKLDHALIIGLYFILLITFPLFYLINIIILIKNKKMFYDNFFQVTYISTIKRSIDTKDNIETQNKNF